jgi:microcystin-dependent protein
MADPFVAEVRIFGFNFAPKGWATCDGQILPLSQNTALFSLLGTTYGGDGKSNFALPNLAGLTCMHVGQGQGLSERFEGEEGGVDFVSLLDSEMTAHSHPLNASFDTATEVSPSVQLVAVGSGISMYGANNLPTTQLAFPQALTAAGGSLPHNNDMPSLTLSFCIAMQGVFPPRP